MLYLKTKERFLQALQPDKENQIRDRKYRVLVLDAGTVKIVNLICDILEITDCNIIEVFQIERKRSNVDSEAVYFLQPTEENIKLIITDFSTTPRYQAAHIYFTYSLAGSDLARLNKNPFVTKKIRNLIELNLFYLYLEANIFTTFNSIPSDIVKSLVTICCTYNILPCLRYYHQNLKHNRMLQEVQTDLQALSLPFDGRTMLIVLDNELELFSTTLDDSYYALLHENILTQGFKYEYTYEDDERKPQQKTFLFDDNDPIWCKYRFQPIGHVVKKLEEEYLKLNQDFQRLSRLERSDSKPVSIKELTEVVHALPRYKKQKILYEVHLYLSLECERIWKNIGGVCQYLNYLHLYEKKLAVDNVLLNKEYLFSELSRLLRDSDVGKRDKYQLLFLSINSLSLSQLEILEINELAQLDLPSTITGSAQKKLSHLNILNLDELSEKEWPYVGDTKFTATPIQKKDNRELFSRSMRTRPRKIMPEKTIAEGTRRLILFFSGQINHNMITPLKKEAEKLDIELILGAESIRPFNF